MRTKASLSALLASILIVMSISSMASRKPAAAARPDPDVIKKAQTAAANGKVSEAVKILTDVVNTETDKDKRALVRMTLAVILFQAGKDTGAEEQFKKAIEDGTRIDDYANYHLGLLYLKGGRLAEARAAFERAYDSMAPSQTQVDARLHLAETYMAEKNYKLASVVYQSLLKKTRNTEVYPNILFNLYKADRKTGKTVYSCKLARELYAKYPSFAPIQDWGADLARDVIDGEKIGCSSQPAELKTRVRRLQLAGDSDRAQKELLSLKDALKGDDTYGIDSMLANHLISEGKVDEAMKLILKHYKGESSRPEYQLLLAKAASRTGEYEAAVGAFMRAYELAPKSRDAATALFQAAFTSYQFQDYDGATRKFERFMKAFPKSKLARDSQWHLAWIRYLRGDYVGANESFRKISTAPVVVRRRRRRFIVRSDGAMLERVQYWTAMSFLKMGKGEEAIPIFQKLVRDPSLGYYSMLSYYRLNSIPGAKIPPGIEVRLGLKKTEDPGVKATAEEIKAAEGEIKASQEAFEAEDETTAAADAPADASTDASADAVTDQAASDEAPASEEGDDAETTAADSGESGAKSFNNAGLEKRFERARDLITAGLEEGAGRELSEIEHHARTQADRKLLVEEYVAVRNYYRSSYMGEVGFGAIRLKEGLHGESRPFWEFAYPRAYEPAVLEAAKNTTVPEELIWGIMRAESHFKQNAQSPVGALGLMQLMPFTGKKVAGLLSLSGFEPKSLLIPETNIRLGSRYLQRLFEKFSGSVPLVAAGYNAGPHRVHAWVRNFGQLDMDEFIDHIPFVETRNYVKNVVRNYQIYSLLYSGGTHSLRWLIKPVGVELTDPVPTKEIW